MIGSVIIAAKIFREPKMGGAGTEATHFLTIRIRNIGVTLTELTIRVSSPRDRHSPTQA